MSKDILRIRLHEFHNRTLKFFIFSFCIFILSTAPSPLVWPGDTQVTNFRFIDKKGLKQTLIYFFSIDILRFYWNGHEIN